MSERILFPQNLSPEVCKVDLTPEQISNYAFLIHEAGFAEAYPDQSGYFVRTAAMAKDETISRGGNKEYGMSDAFVHGETAVVSALRDETDSPIEAIAWYKKGEIGPDDFGRPCGNCRDVLKKYCSPETVLLNGNEKAFVYTRLKDFFFDNFRALDFAKVSKRDVYASLIALRGGTDVYLPEAMKPGMYGAALVSEDKTIWRGMHYSNVGYDSVTPVLSALQTWKNTYPVGTVSRAHLNIARLVIVSETGIPDVFYRDRQAILENDEILRRFTGNAPLEIQLIHARKNGEGKVDLISACQTDTEQWLPGPFSPGAFRMDDVMDKQLRKLIGK